MAGKTTDPEESITNSKGQLNPEDLLLDPTNSDAPLTPLDLPLIAEVWSQPSQQEPLPEIPPLEQSEPPAEPVL